MKRILTVFWSLVAVFVLTGVAVASLRIGLLIPVFGLILFLLGIWLIVLSLKSDVNRVLRRLLILTGASAAGIFVSFILHNLVFGLLIMLFGEGFWERVGIEDEPVFFVLALFVLPIAFIVGVVGSVVLMRRERPRN